MADLELELAQFSFSSAIHGHHVYLASGDTSAHAHCLNAATVQGRPLLRLARVLCGAYSRAAFIRGAAFIQGNTLLKFGVASEGYWNNERFLKQMERAITITQEKYPPNAFNTVWLFDQSSGNCA